MSYLIEENGQLKPIDKDAIEGLPERKVDEKSQGGLDDKVEVRSYKVDSITAIRANGQVVTL